MSDTPGPPTPPPSQPPSGGVPPSAPPPGGQPPSSPPPGGQPGGGGQYTIGNAFNYGWQKFQQNLGPILLGLLAYAVAVMIVTFAWFLLTGALFRPTNDVEAMLLGQSAGPGFVASIMLFGLQALVSFIGVVIIQAAVTRAALAITRGEKIELKTLFVFDDIGQLIIGAIIVGVLTSIGTMLCYFPGLIVFFFAQFYVHFLIDRKLSAIEAIKASFGFVNKNLGTLIGFYLASLVAYFIGALLCGIGLLVAFPVVVIAQAYTYRRLRGETVAA